MSQVGTPVGVMYGHSGTEHGIGAGGAMVKMRIKSVLKIVLGIVTVTNLLGFTTQESIDKTCAGTL